MLSLRVDGSRPGEQEVKPQERDDREEDRRSDQPSAAGLGVVSRATGSPGWHCHLARAPTMPTAAPMAMAAPMAVMSLPACSPTVPRWWATAMAAPAPIT